MAQGITQQIEEQALKIINEHPEGIKYKEIERELQKLIPNLNINTIGFVVPNIPKKHPAKVYKLKWGVYAPIKKDSKTSATEKVIKKPIPEKEFYKPFAEYLENELVECQKAIPLGGGALGGIWNTPDVIGINNNKTRATAIIEFPIEFISAEIKTELKPAVAIQGFGQAVAYKLFSTKSYLVLPQQVIDSDSGRLIALCMVERIGLIGFDHTNAVEPEWKIECRAFPLQPDNRYANEVASILAYNSNSKTLFQ